MKKIIKIVLILMIVMVYAVCKAQKIYNKSETVSKAIKQAEYQKVIENHSSGDTKVEIKSKKE